MSSYIKAWNINKKSWVDITNLLVVGFRFLALLSFVFFHLGDAVSLGCRELLVNSDPILTGIFFHRLVSLLLQLAVVRLVETTDRRDFLVVIFIVVGWNKTFFFFKYA